MPREEYTGYCAQETRSLLCFLSPDARPLRVLVLESSVLLPELRRLLPQAEIHAVTADEEEPQEPAYAGLKLNWQVLDFRHQQLPFAKYYFDLILAERFLEAAAEPGDLTGGMWRFLSETGILLTSFKNIRYHRIIRELQTGHFTDFLKEKPLAKPEVVRMLGVAFYKDVVFAPGRWDKDPAYGQEIERLGFANFQADLSTEIWLVRAARSEPEIALLKEMYRPAVRAALARLLRRIEYDVEKKDALVELRLLVKKEAIFPDYLADFVRHASHRPHYLQAQLELAGLSLKDEMETEK